MRNVTYIVYDFNELSKKAKEKAIFNWYEKEDYPMLKDDIYNTLNYINYYKVFKNAYIQFSLSYCQGDGLSFSADIDIMNFLDNVYTEPLDNYKKNAICIYIYNCVSNGNKGRYCYASKSDIEYNYNIDQEYKRLDKLWNSILSEIEDYYISTCDKLKKDGYEIIEYRMNDIEFNELCESNEYTFSSDGTMDNSV